MVAVQVMGNDAAIGFAGSQGNFELNVFNPVMIHNLLHSVRLLKDACRGFVDFCVEGLELNRARIAVKLSKTCNDLRLLSSGPRAGLGEINLPAVQAGSSIMPGKVNPVIPEVVNQVAFEVIGNDITVTMAAEAGQLQLNAFEPVIAHSLFKSIAHLAAACATLERRCVSGITANVERMRLQVEESTGLVTALTPVIGYARASEIAKEALASGGRVYDLVLARGWMTREQLDEMMRPEVLTRPHFSTVHKPRAEE